MTISGEVNTLADGTIKILTDLDSSGFEKGISRLGSLTKSGLSILTKGVAAVSSGLTAASGYAVKVGSDFEAGMSEVAAISGASGEALQALTDKAKEMGSTTKFSATESAEALKYMAMAGWNTDKMLSGLPGVMNLAAASGENLGTVSDIVTDSMTAFGMAAGEAGHFADVLAQASSKSNTNVALMGETFKYVAPVAGALGYSAEDAAVAIGLMANSGIKGSQAGTALRATLSRLAKPTDEVEAAMEALGISLTDSKGNMKSLSDVMQDMRKGFQGLTEDQKAQYAAALAGQEGMSGLLAIVNTSDEDFNALADAINNADGAAETMASVMQDNLKGAVTIAKSALEGLGITVYEQIESPLKSAVESGTAYINQLNDAFSHGLDKGVEALGHVTASAVTEVAESAPKMLKAGSDLILAFLEGISGNSRKVANSAVKIGKSLVNSLLKIVPEVGKVGIKVITEFVKQLLGYNLGKKFDSLSSTITKSFKKISSSVKTAVGTVSPLLKNLASIAIHVAKSGITVLSEAISFLCDNIEIILPLASAAVAAFAAFSIAQSITTVIQSMTATVQAATKAFAAMNATLLANPYALAAAAIAALAAGIAALILTQEKEITSAELLAESQENLAESCQGVFDQYGAWSDAVREASGSLDALTSTMGITQQKQEELAEEMDSVQAQITQIMKAASDERRSYTQSEIETLQDLFAQMRSLAEQELALQQSYQEAVVTQASALLETQNLTAEQYTTYAAQIAAQATATKDAVIASANDKYTQAIAYAEQEREAVLNSEAGKNEAQRALAEQAYQDAINDANRDYQAAVDAANAKSTDVSLILAQGYAQNAEQAQAWVAKSAEISAEETANYEGYKQELLDIRDEFISSVQSKQASEYEATANAQRRLLEANEKYASKEAATNSKRADSMDATTQRQIAALLEMVVESGAAYGDLDATTQQMVDEFLETIGKLSPETKESLNETLKGMGMTIDDNGKLLYDGGEKSGQEVIEGWESKVPDLMDAADDAIKKMSEKTGGSKVAGPSMGSISGAYSQAAQARSVIQDYLNYHPVYASVRTNARGGYWAKGGVTKYARGGVSPTIHKHAAGVFTKRTRLWDPVTGINEYGEAGHEALLPLKQSVYNEIAKGIVRQLSPAKLSSVVSMLKSAVQSRAENVTIQVIEKQNLKAAEKAVSGESDSEDLRAELSALRAKIDRIIEAIGKSVPDMNAFANIIIRAFTSLRVEMDGRDIGEIVDERLGELYGLREKGAI